MPAKLEVLEDVGTKERKRIAGRRGAKAGGDFFCDCGSADDITTLTHHHPKTRACQIVGSHQPVVARPDYYSVGS
jgi:hypothetical protein